jgi:hypothetical protein
MITHQFAEALFSNGQLTGNGCLRNSHTFCIQLSVGIKSNLTLSLDVSSFIFVFFEPTIEAQS